MIISIDKFNFITTATTNVHFLNEHRFHSRRDSPHVLHDRMSEALFVVRNLVYHNLFTIIYSVIFGVTQRVLLFWYSATNAEYRDQSFSELLRDVLAITVGNYAVINGLRVINFFDNKNNVIK